MKVEIEIKVKNKVASVGMTVLDPNGGDHLNARGLLEAALSLTDAGVSGLPEDWKPEPGPVKFRHLAKDEMACGCGCEFEMVARDR